MLRTVILMRELVRMYIRTKVEYPGAMVLGWVSQFVSYGAVYTAIALIIARFGMLGGWTWSDMAMLLSVHLLTYSVGASFSFTQFREMEDLVRQGTMDAILVKPIGTWLYMVFSGFNIGYAGHVVLAVGLMAWAITQVDVAWSLPTVLFLVATLVSGAMVVCALMTMIGATALVWVRSRHLYSIFFGFWELARYPITIFPLPIQVLLLAVVPMGFISTVPVAVLLGKPVPLLGDFAGLACLLAGPVMAGLAMLHWRWCLRNYQGAGG
ncbi:ABC-2 family transporter protein [Devosia sp. FKR38]|uniref:ABC transporter permease n=1 Tax=Devosia sp. FKR38 TaxID=2562312 RepID=UPI0010C117C2|nr:ABC-2 family transporter protein [Devosia sp. FKR38]